MDIRDPLHIVEAPTPFLAIRRILHVPRIQYTRQDSNL